MVALIVAHVVQNDLQNLTKCSKYFPGSGGKQKPLNKLECARMCQPYCGNLNVWKYCLLSRCSLLFRAILEVKAHGRTCPLISTDNVLNDKDHLAS